MPGTNFSAWYLKKGANNYLAGPDKGQIIYRTNNWNEATLVFNISDPADSIWNQTNIEDAVQVYIGDPSAGGVKMMDGFINDKYPIRRKDATRELYIHVIDYIGYMAAKSIFEQRYWLLANATTKQIFTDAANAIPGIGGTNIDAGLTNLVKQDFAGTYSKDGFSVASQVGFADYFGDELKFLQAFSHGGRDLLASNAVRYKIKDTASLAANEIRVNHNYDYYFKHDATYRFKTVIATSGVAYTWPTDINLFQEAGERTTLRGTYGRDLSTHWTPLSPVGDYDKMNFPNGPVPFDWQTQLQIGAQNYPVLNIYVGQSGTLIGSVNVGQLRSDGTMPTLGIPLDGTWQEMSFFMRVDQMTPIPTTIQLKLADATNGGTFIRDLKNAGASLFLAGGMTFIRYLMPNQVSNNGWTKTGTITTMDSISITMSPLNGYTAGTFFSVAQFYLYKKLRKQSAVLAGTPATQKIIMDRTIIDDTTLQGLANQEYSRVSSVPYEVKCTFYGNSDFRKPGYAIDVDFTNSLETDCVGTQLRIDQIIHTLGPKSRWNTELTLSPAHMRV